MATPLIRALQTQGGTLYAFSSSANDISKTFTDDNARFVFSKFAALKIPNVATPTNNINNIVWEAIGGTGGDAQSALTTNQNINLAQSFQNYVLNFESLVLGGDNDQNLEYDSTIKQTATERIFWKWMAKINAIRFQDADTNTESNFESRFREEELNSTGATQYDPVVQYLGDLDIVNNVSREGHSYSEVLIQIPTSHGNTPLVLFKNITDDNYQPGLNWVGDNEFIKGRSTSTHPSGLDLRAYYDDDSVDEYQAGTTFGNVTNESLLVNSKSIYRSKMDGLALDWDPESYKPITENTAIQFLPEYNTVGESSDFSFNAILIYYDIYNTSNPDDRATNLYGVLILDDYTNTVSGGSLKEFSKFKPNPVTKLNGNAYGLKLNLKFDTSVDNVGVETVINEYNTFSMDLFMDASTRLSEASDMFLNQKIKYIELADRVNNLESYFFNQDTIDLLRSDISQLESQLNNSQLAFESSTSLIDLIANNSDRINTLLNGNTTLDLTFNLDAFFPGSGISIDKTVENQITINNTNQEYNAFSVIKTDAEYLSYDLNNGVIDTTDSDYDERNNIIVLGEFKNYFRNKTPETTLERDVLINIDDSNINWSTGQTMRISFANPIVIGNNSIIVYTDTDNRFNNGALKKVVGTLDTSNLISTKPILDIICINENTYEFVIDVIK